MKNYTTTTFKIKVIFEDDPTSSQNTHNFQYNSTFVEVNKNLTYEALLDFLQQSKAQSNANVVSFNKSLLITLMKENGDEFIVDKNSYDQIRDIILNKASEEEVNFIVCERDSETLSIHKTDRNDKTGKYV